MNALEFLLNRKLYVVQWVTGYFVEVLGRKPTKQEISKALGRFESMGLSEFADSLLRQLLSDSNASTTLGVRLLSDAISEPSSFDHLGAHFLSLGTHCYTSALLSRLGLKRFSAPFDWLFSSLDMVAHCLEDDFRIFLDRQYFRPVPVDQRRDGPEYNLCEHEYYLQNFGVHFVFNHTDPNTEEGYAYLGRCVDRLRAVLASVDRKVFVCVASRGQYSAASLKRVIDALVARTEKYELLCVLVDESDANALLPLMNPIENPFGVHLYAHRPVSRLGGTQFDDPVDELPIARLLRRYRESDAAHGQSMHGRSPA